jgi:hypothetical protein
MKKSFALTEEVREYLSHRNSLVAKARWNKTTKLERSQWQTHRAKKGWIKRKKHTRKVSSEHTNEV